MSDVLELLEQVPRSCGVQLEDGSVLMVGTICNTAKGEIEKLRTRLAAALAEKAAPTSTSRATCNCPNASYAKKHRQGCPLVASLAAR